MTVEIENRIALIEHATELLGYRKAQLELLGRLVGLATALVCLATALVAVAGAIVLIYLR